MDQISCVVDFAWKRLRFMLHLWMLSNGTLEHQEVLLKPGNQPEPRQERRSQFRSERCFEHSPHHADSAVFVFWLVHSEPWYPMVFSALFCCGWTNSVRTTLRPWLTPKRLLVFEGGSIDTFHQKPHRAF